MALLAWGLQLLFFNLLGGKSASAYAVAAALTYVPLIPLNFVIQRKLIFRLPGVFSRYLLACVVNALAVTILSPVCRFLIDRGFGLSMGDYAGFVLASLIGATLSFLLMRHFVFARPLGSS